MKLNYLASLLVLPALTAGLTSCGGKQNVMTDVEMIPVQIESDGNWSMYKPDGTIVYTDEFKNEPSMVINGVFSVKEGDGYSLYRAGEKPEEIKDCQNLKCVGIYKEGLIPVVYPNSRITLINDKGEARFTLEPVGGKEIVKCATSFEDGLLTVTDEEKKSGYFDTKGNCVIKPEYEEAYPFAEGLALVGNMNTKDSNSTSEIVYKVIDKKGETVFKLNKDHSPQSYSFSYGYLLAKDSNDRYILLDKKGEATKLPSKAKSIKGYNAKYIIYENDGGECGVMDYEGEGIVRAKYGNITFIDDESFLAIREEDAYVLDSNGDEKLEISDYKSVFTLAQFGFIGVDRNTYTFLDDKGKERSKDSEFHNIGMDYTKTYVIMSDYFDVAAAINNIVSLVGNDGVGNYKFGTEPSQYFSNASDYSYTRSATLNDLKKEGYRYTITVSANYNEPMTDYSYGYSYYPTFYWNSNSRLSYFAIDINTESEWGIENAEKLTEAFKAKGFKVEKTTAKDTNTYIALLSNGKIKVAVGGTKGETEGGAMVFPITDNDVNNSILSLIETKNQEIGIEPEPKEAIVADTTAAVPVEVAAVEEY